MKNRSIAIIIFFLLLFTYSYVDGGSGGNQNSRLGLLHAVFIHRTTSIDAYHNKTGDKSLFNSHYYSDKAPGTAVVALPAFFVSQLIIQAFNLPFYKSTTDNIISWDIARWISTIGSVGVITAFGGMALYIFLAPKVGKKVAILTTVGVFIGGLPFTYGTMMFSHSIVIGLVMVSFCLISIVSVDKKESKEEKWKWWIFPAGIFAGLAVASEYTSIFAILLLGVFLLEKHSIRQVILFCIGLFVSMSIVPIYNILSFGAIMNIGYSHVVGFEGMNEGFFGFTLPSLDKSYRLLFSSFRGLFFWSPILLLVIPGLQEVKKFSKVLWIGIPLLFIIQTLLISSYFYWHGGYALGPRHLSPIVPFLAVAAGFGFAKHRMIGIILCSTSLFMTVMGTVVDPTPPKNQNLFIDFYLAEISRGRIANNLGLVLGIPGYYSIIPFVLVIAIILSFLLYFSSNQK